MNRQERRRKAKANTASPARNAFLRELESAMELHQAGDLAAAKAAYDSLLERQPRNPDLLHLIGMWHLHADQPDSALSFIEDATNRDPQRAAFHNTKGEALRALGRFEDAIESFHRGLGMAPGEHAIAYNLGQAYLQASLPADAEAVFADLCAADPNDAEALANLAALHAVNGRPESAQPIAEKALRLSPNNPEVQKRVGSALYFDKHYARAAALLENALAPDPDDAEAITFLALCQLGLGASDRALELMEKAAALRPNHPATLQFRGQIFEELGRFDDAERDFKAALDANPNLILPRLSLGLINRFDADAEELEQLEAAADKQGPAQRASLFRTLAKRWDDLDDPGRAFDLYEKANALKAQDAPYQANVQEAYVDGCIAAFDEAYLSDRSDWGLDTERPVFIVGMPRSGTTLTEQILAAHPQVFGAGELMEIPDIRRLVIDRAPSAGAVKEAFVKADRTALTKAGEGFLEFLNTLDGDADRVTDKLPTNFLNVGVILLLFPKARIIHCLRDPMDTCLSCYTTDFADRLSFAYGLDRLGHYYQQYRRLMDHWHKVSPTPILDVHYEELVADPDRIARAMLDHVGLPWDDRVLRYFENNRPIRTASVWQARQPIYTGSVARWKRFERHLEPLRDALGPYAEGTAG